MLRKDFSESLDRNVLLNLEKLVISASGVCVWIVVRARARVRVYMWDFEGFIVEASETCSA